MTTEQEQPKPRRTAEYEEREQQPEAATPTPEPPAPEPPTEPVNEKPEDVLDEEPLTFKKSKEIVSEQAERLMEAGWKPWRDMVGSYFERIVEATKGLADGFEGKKKRDD